MGGESGWGLRSSPGHPVPGESILRDVQRQSMWARRGGGEGGGGGSSMHAGQMAGFNHSSSRIRLPRLRAGTAARARAAGLGLGSLSALVP